MSPTPPLPPCPSSPHCAATFHPKPSRRLEPLELTRDPDEAMEAVVRTLESLPRTEVVEREPRRVRAVCTSGVLGFKDDVVVIVDEASRRVELWSASRLGWWDLGVNRRRLERLIPALQGRV